MKINECTLAAFATSHIDAPPDKEGWLWKKGEVNKAFQRRYFVLKGNLLFYFERKVDREPIGVIILEGCTIELAEDDQERFSFKINFHNGGGEQQKGSRVYHLGTECQDTMEEWMKLLACSSHDYMKLMVYELQQKLAELDAIDVTSSRSCDFRENALSGDRIYAHKECEAPNSITKTVIQNSTSHPDNLTKRAYNVESNGLNSSRSSSALGLGTTPCGARKNPFDDMPPFDPKGSTQTNLINQNQSSTCLPNEGQFAIRDTMSSQRGHLSINVWLNLHSSHGKKITQDRMKWLSRNKIIDL